MPKIIIRHTNYLKTFEAKLESLKNTLPQLPQIAFEKSANDHLFEQLQT